MRTTITERKIIKEKVVGKNRYAVLRTQTFTSEGAPLDKPLWVVAHMLNAEKGSMIVKTMFDIKSSKKQAVEYFESALG